MTFNEYLHFKQGDAHDEWKKVCSEEGLGSPGGFLQRKHNAPYSEPAAFRGTQARPVGKPAAVVWPIAVPKTQTGKQQSCSNMSREII